VNKSTTDKSISEPPNTTADLDRDPLDQYFASFRNSLQSAVAATVKELVSTVLKENKAYYVSQFLDALRGSGLHSQESMKQPVTETEWIDIESLSQLRAVVGGRFQNLRTRWLKAGLPLREHRGDKESSYEIDRAGWAELSGWLLDQGYQSKLVEDEGESAIFQIWGDLGSPP